MIVRHTTHIQASPTRAYSYLLGREYSDAIVDAVASISAIEELSRSSSDGVLSRLMRYSAPTADRIPSFLSKYAHSAPEEVHWRQRERWQREELSMTYSIEAEIREEWRRYYTTHGELKLEPASEGCSLITRIEYSVGVFGLRRLIERSIESEVSKILELQGEVVRRHFSAG